MLAFLKWQSKVSHCRNFMKSWTWWNYVLGLRIYPRRSETTTAQWNCLIDESICHSDTLHWVCLKWMPKVIRSIILTHSFVLNFVVTAFFFLPDHQYYLYYMSPYYQRSLYIITEKNHVIMHNDKMCSHYILASGGWCTELIWLNETDLVFITEVFISDIWHAWKYRYFMRNSVL